MFGTASPSVSVAGSGIDAFVARQPLSQYAISQPSSMPSTSLSGMPGLGMPSRDRRRDWCSTSFRTVGEPIAVGVSGADGGAAWAAFNCVRRAIRIAVARPLDVQRDEIVLTPPHAPTRTEHRPRLSAEASGNGAGPTLGEIPQTSPAVFTPGTQTAGSGPPPKDGEPGASENATKSMAVAGG